MITNSPLPAIFDTAEYLEDSPSLPLYLSHYHHFADDYHVAHAFLNTHKESYHTFNSYRREVERLLQWAWQVARKSIFMLNEGDIEAYLHFCQNPPQTWIGLKKPHRFLWQGGLRVPNPDWRPFVTTVSKRATCKDPEIDGAEHNLSDKAIHALFVILAAFCKFLVRQGLIRFNPFIQAQQFPPH